MKEQKSKSSGIKPKLSIKVKYGLCFAGVFLSLLVAGITVISVGIKNSSPPLFRPETDPSSFSEKDVIETDYGILYLPEGFSFDKEYPLILIFHALGQTHTGALYSSDWIRIADHYKIILFSVKSNEPTWQYDNKSPDLKNTKRLTGKLKKALPVKKESTVLYGFSAGAHYVGYLALHNSLIPENAWFNAFIQISGGSSIELDKYIKKGSLPSYIKTSAVPGYMVWGEREVPPPGKKAAAFLIGQGWDITTHPHNGTHYVPEGEIERGMEWFFNKSED